VLFSKLDSDNIKAFSIFAILVIGPLGAALVVDMFTGDDSLARVTHNRYQDNTPVLLLLDSEDKPHIFWYGWRPPRYWRLYHATFLPSENCWRTETCPVSAGIPSWEFTGAIDNEDNIHLVYAYRENQGKYDGIEHLIRYHNGSWSSPQRILDYGYSPPPRICQLDINPNTQESCLYICIQESESFFVKHFLHVPSRDWELKSEIQIPIRRTDDFVGIRQEGENEIRIQYANQARSDFSIDSLICSYLNLETFQELRTESFPITGNIIRSEYIAEFHAGPVGLLAAELEPLANFGPTTLSFYFEEPSGQWTQNLIAEQLTMDQGYFDAGRESSDQLSGNEYLYTLEMRIAPDTVNAGFYFVRLLTDERSIQNISHGWGLREQGVDNGGPVTAIYSLGRLHIAWLRCDKYPDYDSEIYYDYQGSGWDVIAWSLFQ
ncbi:MAG: hypothetical protein ACFFB3_17875, partial [Candidatus Hodarchaeota archaeon]